MELTDTNRSIDLIVPITNVHLCCAKITLLRSWGAALRGGGQKWSTRGRALKPRLESKSKRTIPTERYQLLEKLLRFADLVVIAERLHPIPFRTRP